jgi:eukaryotic-like serine/threonine-protein kinase
MGNHVFVCYAREDVEFVLELTDNLKARGVTIWLDQDLPAGTNWQRSIEDAIHNCAQFLIVLSPKAVESDQVQGEWLTALDEKKLIVPVIHKTCRVPPPLRSRQHVDFINRDAGNEAVLEQLVRVLGGEQSARTQPPLPPKPSRKLRNLRTPALLFALGILAVVSTWLIRKEETSVRPQSEKSSTAQTEPYLTKESPILIQKPVSPPPEKNEAERSSQPKESTSRPGMVSIPAGDFWMGCNEKVDKECDDDEKPGRTENVKAFWIDRTEVTVAADRSCVQAGGCSSEGLSMPYWDGKEQPDAAWACNWGKEGRDNNPLNCVDWNQAQTYCQWAGKRLPTEAEWEKTARGSDGRKYSWGNKSFAEAGKVANIADETAKKQNASIIWALNGYDDGYYGTAPVGSFPAGASPYGALDMIGNVWEWTADWYDTAHKYRSVRGGSWAGDPRYARVSGRLGFDPGNRLVLVGFRCAQ